ncbi:MAG: GTP 3',8-cyclase MoaA [Acidobacteriota bacterium]|nr:GTP 3',8-cyclase MoaA [Acidobacteriota bacterium]
MIAKLNPTPSEEPERHSIDACRGVHVLRLSVTDRCNFRCRYCMPVRGAAWTPQPELLDRDRVVEQVVWLAQHTGIRVVRITGGEPLVRRDLPELLSVLRAIPQIEELALTTNASMLALHAARLREAGVSRLNISLDTLDPERFTRLTRGGDLHLVLLGIEAAVKAGLGPIKLNAVLQASTWQEDVPALLDYAAELGAELRFIEMMCTGTEQDWCQSEYVSVQTVQRWLQARTQVAMDLPTASPARRSWLAWRGRAVTVGWISPRSHPFCANCERLRMDARGRLRRCLMDPVLLNLPGLRSRLDDAQAAAALARYMADKHPPLAMCSSTPMSAVGG